jgi:hypothetical protein
LPYEGRYDASSLQKFDIDKSVPGLIKQSTLLDTKGQVRDLKWLRTVKYGNILVEAKNNDSLIFLMYKK